MVLLLFGLCLTVVQRRVGRKLSVDLGGAKRLQALSTLVVAIMLLPWAVVQFLTQNVSQEGWGGWDLLTLKLVSSCSSAHHIMVIGSFLPFRHSLTPSS